MEETVTISLERFLELNSRPSCTEKRDYEGLRRFNQAAQKYFAENNLIMAYHAPEIKLPEAMTEKQANEIGIYTGKQPQVFKYKEDANFDKETISFINKK